MRYLMSATLMMAAIPAHAQETVETGQLRSDETLLMISASGSAEAIPDTMGIYIGVTNASLTSEEAIDANNAVVERLVAILTKDGNEGVEITSDNFGVRPRFPDDRRNEGDVRIIGYIANSRLNVEFTDFQDAGQLIPELFAAGANEIGGPYWSISDRETERLLEAEATQRSVQNARASAEDYAAALGLKVGRVIRVADQQLRPATYDADDHSIIVTGSSSRPRPIVPVPVSLTSEVYVEFALVPAE